MYSLQKSHHVALQYAAEYDLTLDTSSTPSVSFMEIVPSCVVLTLTTNGVFEEHGANILISSHHPSLINHQVAPSANGNIVSSTATPHLPCIISSSHPLSFLLAKLASSPIIGALLVSSLHVYPASANKPSHPSLFSCRGSRRKRDEIIRWWSVREEMGCESRRFGVGETSEASEARKQDPGIRIGYTTRTRVVKAMHGCRHGERWKLGCMR